jgi:hypothetical protein
MFIVVSDEPDNEDEGGDGAAAMVGRQVGRQESRGYF